jgi:low affinity Fe/Cu permease
MAKTSFYSWFAKKASNFCGSPKIFAAALLIIILWLITGPIFKYSDTWQLVINTSTSIITFLMVFIIQNSQNRDTQAMEIKLDELIRATKGARNALIDLENNEEEFLKKCKDEYKSMARVACKDLENGTRDTN